MAQRRPRCLSGQLWVKSTALLSHKHGFQVSARCLPCSSSSFTSHTLHPSPKRPHLTLSHTQFFNPHLHPGSPQQHLSLLKLSNFRPHWQSPQLESGQRRPFQPAVCLQASSMPGKMGEHSYLLAVLGLNEIKPGKVPGPVVLIRAPTGSGLVPISFLDTHHSAKALAIRVQSGWW